MKPVVWMGADFCFGGTAMLPGFTGTSGGRSCTASRRSHTALSLPDVGVTLNPEPIARVNLARSGSGPGVGGCDELPGGVFVVPAHAGKGLTAHAATAKILCCNTCLLETDIPISSLVTLFRNHPWLVCVSWLL